MDAAEGVTVSDSSAGGATDKTADAEMEPELAVIAVVPMALALASPVALTLATVPDDELHVTEPVKSCVEPFV